MDPITLEETQKTTRWATRVFTFLFAVTEVNCRLTMTHLYGQPERSQQDFRRIFSEALINNPYQYEKNNQRQSKRSRKAFSAHDLRSLSKNRTFKNLQLFGAKQTTYS